MKSSEGTGAVITTKEETKIEVNSQVKVPNPALQKVSAAAITPGKKVFVQSLRHAMNLH